MPERIARLTQATQENDSETIKMIAHAIKGIASNLHFKSLTDIAKAIEIKGKNGQFDAIAKLLSELKKEWETVLKELLEKSVKGDSK